MTPPPDAEPVLLCIGSDATIAGRLADATASLLADRPVVVLALWEAPQPMGGYPLSFDGLTDVYPQLRAAAERAAAEAASAATAILEQRALHASRRVMEGGRGAWQTILEVADEVRAAVIALGAHDGLAQHPGTLDRETRAIAHRARRPVLVLPPEGPPPTAQAPALFAYDGSPAADDAVRAAAALLRARPALVACAWQSAAYAASISMLAVPDEVARKGAAALDEASRHQAEAHARHGSAQLEAAGSPSGSAIALQATRTVAGAVILAAEDHGAAVVVTGTRGRSRVAAALLGSTAESILRHADRAVLLVPPAAKAH